MRLSLIVNPVAGGGRAGRALPAVGAELRRLGLEHRVQATLSLEHARALAREAAAAGETAVAFGGDGLIGAVAGALRGGDGLLGMLPGGRGNDFARSLSIPTDPVAACTVLSTGTTRRLDLGAVGGRTFIGIASCGFDSVANRIANDTRLVRGNLVYAYGALRALAGWRPAAFTITVDDGPPRSLVGYTVAVANSGLYGGGMRLAPDARLDDGRLELVTVADLPRMRFLALLPSVFRGEHVRRPEVEVVRARRVRIESSRPFTMYADGDPIAELPAEVEVLPGAVRTIAPAAGGHATAAASRAATTA
ncbi:MAG TPA: diacylglycerol kinase family protein [Solirubrobacteraceae bacterium]|nr:diacylglycerol kinase family protein [Solirubrobacteraceae bacterium]